MARIKRNPTGTVRSLCALSQCIARLLKIFRNVRRAQAQIAFAFSQRPFAVIRVMIPLPGQPQLRSVWRRFGIGGSRTAFFNGDIIDVEIHQVLLRIRVFHPRCLQEQIDAAYFFRYGEGPLNHLPLSFVHLSSHQVLIRSLPIDHFLSCQDKILRLRPFCVPDTKGGFV